MSDDGFTVKQEDTAIDSIPIPSTHTVSVTDDESGEEHKGQGTTVESAEESARSKF